MRQRRPRLLGRVGLAALLALAPAASTPRPGAAATAGAAPRIVEVGPVRAPTAVSLETPGTTTRASVGPENEQLPGQSVDPAISDDGSRIVFTYLTVNDGVVATAIVLRDRTEPSTTLVFPTAAGAAPRAFAASRINVGNPDISGNGTWVAFQAGDGKQDQIGMWSSATGVFSPFTETKQRLTWAVRPRLSADGRYLAFIGQTAATTTANLPRFYVLDRQEARLMVVGYDEQGRALAADQYQSDIDISADGQFVAFSNTRFASEDFARQVWRSRVGETQGTMVSVAGNGRRGNGDSREPTINADGSVVAFASVATDLVDGDANGQADVFRWEGGSLQRVSGPPDGGNSDGESIEPALNASGSMIAFASSARNLVPNDSTGPGSAASDRGPTYDIFVIDSANERMARVSVGQGPSEPNGSSRMPALNATGRHIAFSSGATNLVDGDTNEYDDVFVRTRQPAFRVADNPTEFGSSTVGAPPGVVRTATVTSSGSWPVQISAVAVSGGDGAFFVSNDGCSNQTLAPGRSCPIEITFVPGAPGAVTATLSVSARSIDKARTIRLAGEGGAGSIRLDPVVGPPGTVTVVTGSGFGAGLPVSFRWTKGITPTLLDPVVTDANGGFTTQVLVLPNDLEGARRLEATVTLVSGGAVEASARFLVTTPTGAPPTLGMVQVFRDQAGRTIILRR